MRKRYLAFAGSLYDGCPCPSDNFVGSFRKLSRAREAADKARREIRDRYTWAEVFDTKTEDQVYAWYS
jgi:hypothetical protein